MIRILILNLFIFFHPVHVTLTTVTQDPDSDTLKVFFRMYYDDFQLDYKLYYPEFNGGKNDDVTDYPYEMLNKYFTDRVQIYVNNKLLSGKLSDVSIKDYEILMSFIYHSNKTPRVLRIRNQILISIYSDQANFAYLNINNYEDAIKLTVDHLEETIKLK